LQSFFTSDPDVEKKWQQLEPSQSLSSDGNWEALERSVSAEGMSGPPSVHSLFSNSQANGNGEADHRDQVRNRPSQADTKSSESNFATHMASHHFSHELGSGLVERTWPMRTGSAQQPMLMRYVSTHSVNYTL
jgi:hypothetical protein